MSVSSIWSTAVTKRAAPSYARWNGQHVRHLLVEVDAGLGLRAESTCARMPLWMSVRRIAVCASTPSWTTSPR
jgi:hypothetical protein